MTQSKIIHITTTQYSFNHLTDFAEYQEKIDELVQQACQQNQSQLVLLPEYAGLEICSIEAADKPLTDQFYNLQHFVPQLLAFWREIAKRYQVYLQPGTMPIYVPDYHFRNRAYFISPTGAIAYQDKIHLTTYENGTKVLIAGDNLNLFKTTFGNIGIAICYDSEFPMLVNRLVTAGADIILVPACTDTLSGFHRVHLSCRARALENQCYVIHSCTVGNASWCEAIDTNVGYSGIYSPIDLRLPNNGVICQGELNQTQSITGAIDLSYLRTVRQHGFVRNLNDQSRTLTWLHTINPTLIDLST